jgi:uncharacterized protein YkwD
MTLRKRRLVASVAATASAMIATLVATASASAGCAHATQTPTSVAQARTATLCLLNEQRRHHHLAPLRREVHLEKAATAYSHKMAR